MELSLTRSPKWLRSPASWQPPEKLLKSGDNAAEFAGYRHRHAGYEVLSYSRMKQAWSVELDPLERDEFRREAGQELITVAPTVSELPGGTAAGLMLHEILENIPFDLTAIANRPRDLALAQEPVAEVVGAAMDRNGIGWSIVMTLKPWFIKPSPSICPWTKDRSIPGLCGCGHYLREMEFLFPFPEDFHPPLSEPTPGKFAIGRGYIKGFVDLVIEHDSQVYFGDWKSDVLPLYSSETLKKHVADHYELQAKLYSMALVKALAIRTEDDYERSFGGLFYIFLRSLLPHGTLTPEPGVYFERPSWAQILTYEGELKRFAMNPSGGRS